jgi:hypothetical protein
VKFFHDELFSNVETPPGQPTGLLLVGYSAGSRRSEAWEINLVDPHTRPVPEKVVGHDDYGWRILGQAVAVSRLIEGVGPGLKKLMRKIVQEDHREQLEAFLRNMAGPAVVPSMPLADAIDLARFCAEVTVGYSRFTPGAETVGGPIDVAAISRHERFKWVQRKHYYPPELNPRRPHDHDL